MKIRRSPTCWLIWPEVPASSSTMRTANHTPPSRWTDTERSGPSGPAVSANGYPTHSKYDRAPSETALKTALPTLAGDAKYSGRMRAVHLRVAKQDGAYWLDL